MSEPAQNGWDPSSSRLWNNALLRRGGLFTIHDGHELYGLETFFRQTRVTRCGEPYTPLTAPENYHNYSRSPTFEKARRVAPGRYVGGPRNHMRGHLFNPLCKTFLPGSIFYRLLPLARQVQNNRKSADSSGGHRPQPTHQI